jgi:hypothetical protein
MITATNPVTDEQFELPEDTQVSEIVTDPNTGEMFEVKNIENNEAELEQVTIEEDWGE